MSHFIHLYAKNGTMRRRRNEGIDESELKTCSESNREMATEFPLAGSFTTYSARFVDEAFGFAIGWNYAFNDAISTAGDLTAAQVIVEYWTDHLTWLPSLFFLFFLLAINMIHVKAYGEVSFC